MNFKPTPKKIIKSVFIILITYLSLPVISLIYRYLICINFNPHENIGIGPHVCEQGYMMIFRVWRLSTEPLFLYTVAILFLLIYLIYSLFEKK